MAEIILILIESAALSFGLLPAADRPGPRAGGADRVLERRREDRLHRQAQKVSSLTSATS